MKKKLIGTILTLLCTGVVAFSGWQVYKIMSEYQSGEKVYLELEEYVSPPTEEKITDHQTESSESENKTILPVVEFEKLKSINNDFVPGYIAKELQSIIQLCIIRIILIT